MSPTVHPFSLAPRGEIFENQKTMNLKNQGRSSRALYRTSSRNSSLSSQYRVLVKFDRKKRRQRIASRRKDGGVFKKIGLLIRLLPESISCTRRRLTYGRSAAGPLTGRLEAPGSMPNSTMDRLERAVAGHLQCLVRRHREYLSGVRRCEVICEHHKAIGIVCPQVNDGLVLRRSVPSSGRLL